MALLGDSTGRSFHMHKSGTCIDTVVELGGYRFRRDEFGSYHRVITSDDYRTALDFYRRHVYLGRRFCGPEIVSSLECERQAHREYQHARAQARLTLIDGSIRNMSKDKKILDLGCGVGGWLNLLEQCGFMNVQGWDISSLAAPVAEILWRHTLHIENHEVSGALSNASEELISTFALITAFDFVEHVWHDQTLLQGIHGLLSPGGQLVIEVPIVPINASTSDLADYDLLYPEHHLHLYSYSGIRANAEQSGFHVDTGFVISNSNKALLILGK